MNNTEIVIPPYEIIDTCLVTWYKYVGTFTKLSGGHFVVQEKCDALTKIAKDKGLLFVIGFENDDFKNNECDVKYVTHSHYPVLVADFCYCMCCGDIIHVNVNSTK